MQSPKDVEKLYYIEYARKWGRSNLSNMAVQRFKDMETIQENWSKEDAAANARKEYFPKWFKDFNKALIFTIALPPALFLGILIGICAALIVYITALCRGLFEMARAFGRGFVKGLNHGR